ncbi:uncharacterized protein BP01DRAFT_382583 [Aspergillus saccharolyticus JOP 1030-1]|uniref:Uncharacterized protein n=1 Tax=Aspergillus saccharolyticus JOP 1030-1 TaxID=1450539 RepID=A0A319AFK7_9EURO|nr:hypothetical protein BP01DRAFT_382583 [Aspergillus saccharolyticus JOP 1030-1]PYH45562.1 hypothetical protein BP01DRAFT_382583 [Aspergillus saccharolyticus JOP 1030-1]
MSSAVLSDTDASMLERKQRCEMCLFHLAGRLFQLNVSLDLLQICPPGKLWTNLPQYSWQPDISHWDEARVAREWRFRQYPPHEFLGFESLRLALDIVGGMFSPWRMSRGWQVMKWRAKK